MDVGIAGRRVLVCDASRGLGFACVEALAGEGAAVTLVSRSAAAHQRRSGRIGKQAYDDFNNLLPGTIMTERIEELGAKAQGLIDRVSAGRAGVQRNSLQRAKFVYQPMRPL